LAEDWVLKTTTYSGNSVVLGTPYVRTARRFFAPAKKWSPGRGSERGRSCAAKASLTARTS
jgi:hypothetical protein